MIPIATLGVSIMVIIPLYRVKKLRSGEGICLLGSRQAGG